MKNLITKFKEKNQRKADAMKIEETGIMDYFGRTYSKEHISKDKRKFIQEKGWPSTIYESSIPIIKDKSLSEKPFEDLFVCAYMLTNELAATSFIWIGQPYDLKIEESRILRKCTGMELAYGRYEPSSLESNQFFNAKGKEIKDLYGEYISSYNKIKEGEKIK